MEYFPTQLKESDYLKGIIRNSKVITNTSGNYYPVSDYLDNALINNNFNYYWHSIEDPSYKQYVQVIFLDNILEVDSYLFSTGTNGIYFSKTWDFCCSLDGKEWYTIDQHNNDPDITSTGQKLIFYTEKIIKCRYFSFNITGTDNQLRNYGYVGPVEFYGKKFPLYHFFQTTTKTKNLFHIVKSLIYLMLFF